MWYFCAALLLCASVQGVRYRGIQPLRTVLTPPSIQNAYSKASNAIQDLAGPPQDGLSGFLQPRSVACGISGTGSRITGGTDALPGEYPWLAAMTARDDPFVFCMATVVSEFFVVTAAHCVRIFDADELDILVNKHTTEADPSEVRFKVAEIIIHPDYIPYISSNDIALLRLSSSMEDLFYDASSAVLPICLPHRTCTITDPASCLVGQTAVIAGWGLIQQETFDQPTVVQRGEVPIIDNRNCQRRFYAYQDVVPILPNMLCAGFEFGEIDTCQGDSGGPLAVAGADGAFVLEGVVSFGRGCGHANFPGVYTRVSAFADWIEANIY
ncbi:trypsin-1-like [Pollicipes pollicipes]|uniref:trypsin-1-like n=1 Tax=Pollicipes pollicipes TaxID=41117 RepID=UPI0018852425|nr:trypsin-1-like [Pollicipes pollicipes]